MNKKNKTLFVINKHSFIDVITNSSTELFIMDKNKSDDFLNNVLNEILVENNLDREEITIRWLNNEEKILLKYYKLGKIKEERDNCSFIEYKLYLKNLEKEDLELARNSKEVYITSDEDWEEYISNYRNYFYYLDEDSLIIEVDDNDVDSDSLDEIEAYSSYRVHMW